jgi:UDP-2-acetamido-3-amino-2,3-dideoxy-glucuronate N-acetyltransferase
VTKRTTGSRRPKVLLPKVYKSSVGGVKLFRQMLVRDPRGDLSAGEFRRDLPFQVKRYFFVFNVPHARIRGEHAHRRCHQLLICVKGSCRVTVDDGRRQESFRLKGLRTALYIPPGVWASQSGHSPGTMLLVFASHPYRASDYVRRYEDFLSLKGR